MSIKVDEYDPIGELKPSFPFRNVKIQHNVDVRDYYDLNNIIGRGKFGTVHKCMERKTGTFLAAKFVPIAKKQDRINVEREVEIMRTLQHPRLIQLYDAFEIHNVMCVVLELIEGGELFERVIDNDFILTEKACSVFVRQICEGVSFIHQNNIIHLDLKPENILCLTKTGNRIKIIDFGLARKYDPNKKLQVLFGTPEFVAPEVVNFDEITSATDMWSVGVICYVLLSGLSPFMGETDLQTMTNVTMAQYDFDDEAFDTISADAKDFITKLLVKVKEKRMTGEECLLHPWLKRKPPPPLFLDQTKENLKTFVDTIHTSSPFLISPALSNGSIDSDSTVPDLSEMPKAARKSPEKNLIDLVPETTDPLHDQSLKLKNEINAEMSGRPNIVVEMESKRDSKIPPNLAQSLSIFNTDANEKSGRKLIKTDSFKGLPRKYSINLFDASRELPRRSSLTRADKAKNEIKRETFVSFVGPCEIKPIEPLSMDVKIAVEELTNFIKLNVEEYAASTSSPSRSSSKTSIKDAPVKDETKTDGEKPAHKKESVGKSAKDEGVKKSSVIKKSESSVSSKSSDSSSVVSKSGGVPTLLRPAEFTKLSLASKDNTVSSASSTEVKLSETETNKQTSSVQSASKVTEQTNIAITETKATTLTNNAQINSKTTSQSNNVITDSTTIKQSGSTPNVDTQTDSDSTKNSEKVPDSKPSKNTLAQSNVTGENKIKAKSSSDVPDTDKTKSTSNSQKDTKIVSQTNTSQAHGKLTKQISNTLTTSDATKQIQTGNSITKQTSKVKNSSTLIRQFSLAQTDSSIGTNSSKIETENTQSVQTSVAQAKSDTLPDNKPSPQTSNVEAEKLPEKTSSADSGKINQSPCEGTAKVSNDQTTSKLSTQTSASKIDKNTSIDSKITRQSSTSDVKSKKISQTNSDQAGSTIKSVTKVGSESKFTKQISVTKTDSSTIKQTTATQINSKVQSQTSSSQTNIDSDKQATSIETESKLFDQASTNQFGSNASEQRSVEKVESKLSKQTSIAQNGNSTHTQIVSVNIETSEIKQSDKTGDSKSTRKTKNSQSSSNTSKQTSISQADSNLTKQTENSQTLLSNKETSENQAANNTVTQTASSQSNSKIVQASNAQTDTDMKKSSVSDKAEYKLNKEIKNTQIESSTSKESINNGNEIKLISAAGNSISTVKTKVIESSSNTVSEQTCSLQRDSSTKFHTNSNLQTGNSNNSKETIAEKTDSNTSIKCSNNLPSSTTTQLLNIIKSDSKVFNETNVNVQGMNTTSKVMRSSSLIHSDSSTTLNTERTESKLIKQFSLGAGSIDRKKWDAPSRTIPPFLNKLASKQQDKDTVNSAFWKLNSYTENIQKKQSGRTDFLKSTKIESDNSFTKLKHNEDAIFKSRFASSTSDSTSSRNTLRITETSDQSSKESTSSLREMNKLRASSVDPTMAGHSTVETSGQPFQSRFLRSTPSRTDSTRCSSEAPVSKYEQFKNRYSSYREMISDNEKLFNKNYLPVTSRKDKTDNASSAAFKADSASNIPQLSESSKNAVNSFSSTSSVFSRPHFQLANQRTSTDLSNKSSKELSSMSSFKGGIERSISSFKGIKENVSFVQSSSFKSDSTSKTISDKNTSSSKSSS